MAELDPDSCDAIVTVSGDGLVHEVINVLCATGKGEVPISALPGGSANAFSCMLCDHSGLSCSLPNSAYVTIRGTPTPLDITKLTGLLDRPVFSFLSVSWGFIADVDIGSEKLRWIGAMRFDVYGLWKLFRLKRYQGRVVIYGESGEMVENGLFLSFISCNLPFIGTDMHVAPRAAMNDGCNDLLYVRAERTGRWKLAQVLLRQDKGEHLGLRQLQYVKCRRWRLDPGEGIYSVDGELYEARGVEAEVLQGYARTLTL